MDRVVAFDSPFPVHAQLPFETRYETILSDLPSYSVVVSLFFILPLSTSVFEYMKVVASRLICIAASVLHKLTNCVIDNGGEGLVLRKPGSLYEYGRSASLLKLKVCHYNFEPMICLYNMIVIVER